MFKDTSFGQDARLVMKQGIDGLADAVKVTLGPSGRNVIIDKHYGDPVITKDGVTVAKEIYYKDPVKNMGAQLIKSVASKTANEAGDGTTTATVLTQAIINEGIKHLVTGCNAVDLKRGIDLGAAAVVEYLKGISIPVGEHEYALIEKIATLSANNDKQIGELIRKAMESVSKNGVVTVEESKESETTLKVVEGMEFERGYISPYFCNNVDDMTVVFENPVILLYEPRISTMKSLIPILEKAVQTNRPLVIISENCDGDALATLVVNRMRNNLRVAAVKSPGFGDNRGKYLDDISVLTGGQFIDSKLGIRLEDVSADAFGGAQRVIITKDTTTIIGGHGNPDAIKERVRQIQVHLETSEQGYERDKLQDRLAKLSGGVAVISVGAKSEVEMKERKDRIDDALHATRAAIKEGFIPGGGSSYCRASEYLHESPTTMLETVDERHGFNIVVQAIQQPLRQIATNAGLDAGGVIAKLLAKEPGIGFDARKKQYIDLVEAGIIDPTKVARVALENAASVAGMFLTTECVISDILEDLPRNNTNNDEY